MADGDGATDITDRSGNGKGVALNIFPFKDIPVIDDVVADLLVIPKGGMIYTATTNEIRVGDGLTAGGIQVALATDLVPFSAAVISVSSRASLAGINPIAFSKVMLIEGDRSGLFVWTAGNYTTQVAADTLQGIYIARTSDPTGATGSWIREFDGPINIMWFGAAANDPGVGAFGTDDYPAFAAAVTFSQNNAIAGYENPTFYRGGLPIHIPKGGYYFSQSLAPLFTGKIYGDGGKSWGAATRIRFPAGIDGIQLQAHNTSGKTTLDGVTHFAGDRLYIHDIAFIGAYSGVESDTHGIRGKRAGMIERCTFDNFEGDGLYTNVTAGSGIGSTEGNANTMRVVDCDFVNCRNGRYQEGDDANAISFLNCSYISNRQAGAREEAFLGNHEYGAHFDANARTSDNTGTADKPASYCWSGGNAYFCIRGQETWCAANAPSGTTADNTGWGWAWTAGAATPSNGVPEWAGGMTWRAGGPIIGEGVNNRSTWSGIHVEENGIIQLDQAMLASGFIKTDYIVRVTGGALLRNRVNSILGTTNGVDIGGNLHLHGSISALDPTNTLGPSTGSTVQDGTTRLASRNTSHTLQAQIFDSAGVPAAVYASLGFFSTLGTIMNVVNTGHLHRFRVNNVDKVTVGNTALSSSVGLTIVADTSSLLEVGRFSAGIPNGIIRPNSTATSMLLRSPDNSNSIEITNTVINCSDPIQRNGVQVVNTRVTGWTADTGTAKRTANATYVPGSALAFGAAYVEAELDAAATRIATMETAMQEMSQTIKALKDDLIAHGLIGT